MKVSILMPFYNRKQFIPLIIQNIKNQTYPHDKLRLIIDDDSEEKFSLGEIQNLKDSIYPVELIYLSTERKTIGKKRNDLNKYVFKNYGKNSIVANMDTDDFYNPVYIEYGVKNINKGYLCYGSSQMLFTFPHLNYRMSFIQTNNKDLIHEATMIHSIKFWKASGGYNNHMTGEGKKMLEGFNSEKIMDTDIRNIMICISHNNNTIDKKIFEEERLLLNHYLDPSDQIIVDKCLNIKKGEYEIVSSESD